MKKDNIMIVDGVRHKLVECKEEVPCETCSLHSKCGDYETLCNSDEFYCHFEKIEESMSEIKINIPEGMEIDKENSTFECIKFKPIKKKRWRDNKDANVRGYYIDPISIIKYSSGYKDYKNTASNYNLFTTEKLAKSALAMARISQIMANDKRFGGVVTDEEWNNNSDKFVIDRYRNEIETDIYCSPYVFLAFHTKEQRDLFLEENEDLVRDYLML